MSIETRQRCPSAHMFAAVGLVCLALAGCGADSPRTPQIVWPTPAAITYGTALTAAQLDATSRTPGAFTYAPASGTLLPSGPHTLSVTFTPADPAGYTTATASVQLLVDQATPVITWPIPATIGYGTALSSTQLDATSSVPGTPTYTPAPGTVLPLGSHALSVTFTPADPANYATATASVMISVDQASPVITWPTPAAIVYGTALSSVQLDASTTVPGTFTYNPSLGKLLSAGSHTLSVNFVPTDSASYKSSTASTALTVTQATPQIEWAPAGPFAAGMPLGTAQLDASAMAPGGTSPLPGTFVYSPDAGTVVASSGPQTFAVTFTPNDDVDYVTAEANASLDVLPFGVVAWGDSLTDGEDGLYDLGAYPADLVSLLVLPVINEGVGGQTSTQIGVREGAVPTYVTVAGGVIPASGGVKVTFQTGYEPVTISGPSGGTSGTILGVHGTVTIDSGDTTFTFTRTTQGSAVNAPGHPPLAVDKPYDKYIPIFWEGRNNLNEPSQVLSDLAAQVASVSAGQNYAVLSITNINTPDEWVGGTAYRSIQELNAELSSNFGSHYLDIRKTLVESYNPDLITDVSDFAHDEIPTSLRAVDTQNATLRNSIGPSDTTLTIETSNVSALRIGAILTVDTGDNAENMCIATVNGNTVTVRRNYGGNKTSHAAGVPVVETDETHLNAQGYQVVANAVAQYLSAYEVSK